MLRVRGAVPSPAACRSGSPPGWEAGSGPTPGNGARRAHSRAARRTVSPSGHLRTDEVKDLTGMGDRLVALQGTVVLERRALRMAVGAPGGQVEIVQDLPLSTSFAPTLTSAGSSARTRATTCPQASCPLARWRAFTAFSADCCAAKHAHSWRPSRWDARACSRSRSAWASQSRERFGMAEIYVCVRGAGVRAACARMAFCR